MNELLQLNESASHNGHYVNQAFVIRTRVSQPSLVAQRFSLSLSHGHLLGRKRRLVECLVRPELESVQRLSTIQGDSVQYRLNSSPIK